MTTQIIDNRVRDAFASEKKKCLDLLKSNPAFADRAFRQLVKNFPTVAEAHHLLAANAEENPPSEETLTHALMATRLAPDNFQYVLLLAILYFQLQLPELAVPVCRKVIKLNADNFTAYHILGQCLDSMGLANEALENYQTALKCEPPPELRPEIIMAMASAARTSNKNELAISLYRKIAQSNNHFRNYAVSLEAFDAKVDAQSEIWRAVNKALAQKNITANDRAHLLLAKGKLYELAGEYDQAFLAWAGARKYSRLENWRLRNHVDVFSKLSTFYTAETCSLLRDLPPASKNLAIICGMPRSGTTLTEQIIATHSQAAGIGEFGRWKRLESYVRDQRFEQAKKENLSQVDWQAELAKLSDDTFHIMLEIVGRKPDLIVEKLPHNFMYAGFIKTLFPSARFIHIRRNPLDSFISSYQNPLNQSHGYVFDQVEYVKEFLFHERLMAHWKTLFPDQIYTLHYEELALEPEKHARALLEFVGLPWEDGVLEFYKSDKSVRTFSKDQVRNPVYTKSIGRWKVYDKHLGPIKNALAEAGFSYPDFS